METIRNYLDNMFTTLPKTSEMMKMKEDLLINMEDKYNELREEGRSENEAVGIVIAEFGNIEELAKELNINLEQPGDYPIVDLEEAEAFIDSKKKSTMLVAAGVALIITGLSMFILLSAFEGFNVFSHGASGNIANIIGVSIFLLFVAVAVGMFIYSNTFLESYKYLEGKFHLTLRGENYVKTQRDLFRNKKTFITIISVLLFIISPIPIFITDLFPGNVIQTMGIVFMFIFIAIGVANLIILSGPDSAYKMLLQIDGYSVKEKEDNKIIGAIAAVWWPVTTCIYLFWSFTTGNWGFSWIIWPISSLLFGAIAGASSIMSKK